MLTKMTHVIRIWGCRVEGTDFMFRVVVSNGALRLFFQFLLSEPKAEGNLASIKNEPVRCSIRSVRTLA